MFFITDGLEIINRFMDQGGQVLWLIALVTFLMWMFVFERIIYFRFGLPSDVQEVMDRWEGRAERKSWAAHAVRDMLISQTSVKINNNLNFIATLVAMCPLMGLLGTVTGMIEVFNIMAVTGGGDAKSMAGGVSKATIPTMAGMVAALSGVFANTYVTSKAGREDELLKDHMTADH